MNCIILKDLRNNAGLSQEDIAKHLKITKSAYSRKENGKLPFSLKEVKIIIQILKVPKKKIINIFLD